MATDSAIRTDPTPEIEAAWELAANYRFNKARDAFSNLARANPTDRGLRLGEASALLNAQPRTKANLAEATVALEALVNEEPEDDVGITAAYLLARILHVHQQPADYAGARRRYLALAERRSPHRLAQLAVVNLAMLELYAPGSSDPAVKRIEAAESLAPYLMIPAARAHFHIVLGRACLAFDQPESKALSHLTAALDQGIASDRIRADTAISAGLLAIECGRAEDASRFLRLFLEENPRDVRAWTARQELKRITMGDNP